MEPLLINRELSWLDFNERVLKFALNQGIPLLERSKFIAIFSSNLDEFFQVRVAALHDQVEAGIVSSNPTEVLSKIRVRVSDLIQERDRVASQLLNEIANSGISIVTFADLSSDEQSVANEHFVRRVFPVLTPLAVDPAHPFPYVSNLALSIGVFVGDKLDGEKRFARVKIPDSLNRLVQVSAGRFIFVDEIICNNIGSLFPAMTVTSPSVFRVTRNSDLDVQEDEAEDLLAAVEMELRRRRFGNATRLESDDKMTSEMLALLLEELELDPIDVYRQKTSVDPKYFLEWLALRDTGLRDIVWPSAIPGRLARAKDQGASFFSVIRNRELLVHHPYESFQSSVEEFVAQAASDPQVVGIKATLYRTSENSPIAQSLIVAAARGVQVVALIELKARFDEQTNVEWAKALERAGVHVVYGMVGLKTHSKCILVVRDEDDGLRRYAHIGTGNYNSSTAKVYEDMGLFTCDPETTNDVSLLFNHLTGFSHETDYQNLVVAPHSLRKKIIDLIENEITYGDEGRISIKVNSISDSEIIRLLAKATEAGVLVEILVRGICRINRAATQVEKIKIRSVLGRYLEHSRTYRFAHGDLGKPLYLIGSADLMPRNLDNRVEVLVPISHEKHRRWMDQVHEFMWSSGVHVYEQNTNGEWEQCGPALLTEETDAQAKIARWSYSLQSAQGVPSDFDVNEAPSIDGEKQLSATFIEWFRSGFSRR